MNSWSEEEGRRTGGEGDIRTGNGETKAGPINVRNGTSKRGVAATGRCERICERQATSLGFDA